MKISAFKNGFQLVKEPTKTDLAVLEGRRRKITHRRGRVLGWSDASRRRLRRTLLTLGGVGDCYGLTCTLPGCELDVGGLYDYVGEFGLAVGVAGYCLCLQRCLMDEWRAIVNRWSVYTARAGVSGIYRIELQERGAPHIHFVFWVSDGGMLPDAILAWLNALRASSVDDERYGTVGLDCLDGAMLHSWHLERVVDGDFAAYRYLCDHASKHKQAQLGYIGRQWGIVRRRGLVDKHLVDFDLSDHEYDLVLRYIRRLSHCRVSRGRFGRTTWFTSPATLAKIIDFVREK